MISHKDGLEVLPEHPVEEAYCRVYEGDPTLGRVCEEFVRSIHRSVEDPVLREACEVVMMDLHRLMSTLHELIDEVVCDPDLDISMPEPIKMRLH